MTEPTSAGATPVAGGATPSQTPAQPAAPASGGPQAPATGDDGLGDAGKRAIQQEREARAAATRERDDFKRQLEELQNASRTEGEKAIAAARKEGAAEVLGKYQVAVRRSEVRAALSSAGIAPSLLDLAIKADEFSSLKVTDDGDVEGLAAAVDAFKKAKPDLFKAPANGAAPDFGGGPRGTPAGGGTDVNSLIRRAAGRA